MSDSLPFHTSERMTWEDLRHGAPTVIALARLCGEATGKPIAIAEEPTVEMEAILIAARRRGAMELKASNDAFNAVERMLAVYVEQSPHRVIEFRYRDDARLTMRFLNAFSRLCASGAIAHHLFADFSLTHAGYEWADSLESKDATELIDLAPVQGADHSA